MKQAMDEPKEGATTLKKKAQEKLAAKANPVVAEAVVEAPVAEAAVEEVIEAVVETPAEAVVETPAEDAAAE
jgi:small subunit ribosomal protein S16